MRSIRLSFALFTILLLSVISTKVLAETTAPSLDNYSDVSEIADEALKLDIKILDQYYPSKKIKIELTIDSSVDSGRTAVDWITNVNILKAEDLERDLVDLNKGQKTVLTKVLIPQTMYSLKGINKTGVAVKVTAASYEKNYISVKKNNFELNKDFEITPQISTYETQRNIFQLFSWVLGIIVTLVLIALIAIGAQKFIIYLNSD